MELWYDCRHKIESLTTTAAWGAAALKTYQAPGPQRPMQLGVWIGIRRSPSWRSAAGGLGKAQGPQVLPVDPAFLEPDIGEEFVQGALRSE